MKNFYPSIGLNKLCRLFGKTRQAFYDHQWRQSNDQLQEAIVVNMIQSIRCSLPKIGGVKLHFMLRDDLAAHKIFIGRDNFFKLLRKHNLLVKRKKKYARTTDSNHFYKKWPDLTQNLTLTSAQQLWVSDITYLRTSNGFIYLSLITDVYSKKIVGYHLSQQLKAQGCLVALKKAIHSLDKNYQLIHHSDRGIQYCCDSYVTILQANGIAISMTQSGSPYENPIAERVNGILKMELRLDTIFTSYSAAVPVVHHAIDAYNRIRPHMSSNNLTPAKAHNQTGPLPKKWKTKKRVKPNP